MLDLKYESSDQSCKSWEEEESDDDDEDRNEDED